MNAAVSQPTLPVAVDKPVAKKVESLTATFARNDEFASPELKERYFGDPTNNGKRSMPGFPNLDISGIESDHKGPSSSHFKQEQDNENDIQDFFPKQTTVITEDDAPDFDDAFGGNSSNPKTNDKELDE